MENVDPIMGIVIPYFNFFLFVAMAIYFFKAKAKQAALEAKLEYEKKVAQAQKEKLESLESLQTVEKRYKDLDKELEEIKVQALKTSEIEANRIKAEAQNAADYILKETKKTLQSEAAAMKSKVKQEIMNEVQAQVLKRVSADMDKTKVSKFNSVRLSELKSI